MCEWVKFVCLLLDNNAAARKRILATHLPEQNFKLYTETQVLARGTY